MITKALQDISGSLGDELRSALDESMKDAALVGGGLRHGEVEWQVRFHGGGLERFLFFSLDSPADHLVRIAVRGAATDAEGRWGYIPIASTTLPEEILREQLGAVVRSMFDHGRMLVNTIEHDGLAPSVHEYFTGGP